MKCVSCDSAAKVKVAKTRQFKCVPCFLQWFEDDVHQTIVQTKIFCRGEKVALGVSGGKDSTVLATVMNKLNKLHNYGLEIVLICIDEGIRGYRDDSIREARKTESDLGLTMTILSYKSIYGWTMDEIVARIGKKNNCTFCGVFRRQALDRGAIKAGAVKLVTGHNADDLAETVLMNILRGDVARLQRMAAHVTPGGSTDGEEGAGALPRVKPLRAALFYHSGYSYEKDIVMYAHYLKLNYFSTECIYAPNSYRGNARTLIKDLERERSQVIMDLILSGESLVVRQDKGVKLPVLRKCEKCAYISSQRFCKACLLLYGLNNEDYAVGTSAKKSKASMKIMLEFNDTAKVVEQDETVQEKNCRSEAQINGDETNRINSCVETGGGCACQQNSMQF